MGAMSFMILPNATWKLPKPPFLHLQPPLNNRMIMMVTVLMMSDGDASMVMHC